MKFKYKAKNNKGELQEGFVEASSTQSANRVLTQNNLTLLSLEIETANNFMEGLIRLWEGVSVKEFVIFSRQLSILIESKVPLMSALQCIADQTENRFFALKIRMIIVTIDGGASFSEALSKHRDTFTPFYINMVKAGEASGTLQKTLNDLADNIENNYDLTSKLKSVMYYPAFILFVMMAVGFVIMAFVMPKLLIILKETEMELPIQTRILIFVSDFLANYWWAVIIVLVGVFFALLRYKNTVEGKREADELLLKIPILKLILKNIYITRFTENFSTLIESGLPVTTALMITGDVVGNEVYKEVIQKAVEEIKKGGSIADTFSKHDIIPPMVVQMLSVGESTGKIDYALKKITSFYLKETDRLVKNFSTLIEPIIMVILALGVALLVSAVMLPIYQAATSIH